MEAFRAEDQSLGLEIHHSAQKDLASSDLGEMMWRMIHIVKTIFKNRWQESERVKVP